MVRRRFTVRFRKGSGRSETVFEYRTGYLSKAECHLSVISGDSNPLSAADGGGSRCGRSPGLTRRVNSDPVGYWLRGKLGADKSGAGRTRARHATRWREPAP